MGWRLAYEHWGHGSATEAATAWLDHGFGALGLERVISITDRPNLRSQAVMRRLGMVIDHDDLVAAACAGLDRLVVRFGVGHAGIYPDIGHERVDGHPSTLPEPGWAVLTLNG